MTDEDNLHDAIVVEKRTDDWIAYLKSNPAVCIEGENSAGDAIDKLNVALGDDWYRLLGLS